EEVHPAEVALLMDDSASMRRTDSYGDENLRAALASASGLAPAQSSRLELARAVAARELQPLLAHGGYSVDLCPLSESAAPAPDLSALSGRGGATHLGDALYQALSAQRGKHITDVVVISDGRSNGGLAPLEAARTAGVAGIPVHTLVVGDTRAEKNAVLEIVDAPSE